MILKKLSESISRKELIKDIKEKDSRLGELRDTTISNIISIFKDDTLIPEKDIKAEDIISWFNESESFGNFVTYYLQNNLFTYSICDLAEHEEKLAKSVKELLKEYGIINDEGRDITVRYSKDETPRNGILTTQEMCYILFDLLCQTPVKHDPDYDKIDPKLLSDETKFDFKKQADILKDLKRVYDSLNESLKEEQEEKSIEIDYDVQHDDENGEGSIGPEDNPTEEPTEKKEAIVETAFSDIINNAIQKEWDIISTLNALVATFEYNYNGENKEDILSIINEIVDDSTVNVGMLHKVAELVSTKMSDLLMTGMEKAEEIMSEPATKDLE